MHASFSRQLSAALTKPIPLQMNLGLIYTISFICKVIMVLLSSCQCYILSDRISWVHKNMCCNNHVTPLITQNSLFYTFHFDVSVSKYDIMSRPSNPLAWVYMRTKGLKEILQTKGNTAKQVSRMRHLYFLNNN